MSTSTAVIYLRVSTKEQASKGGRGEGFSIPAQRESCRKKAETLGAVVVEEFVDRGESAKSSDRAELQKMLRFLVENPTGYVIVHKVDRLARNRADDVAINVCIQEAGAALVSCTESIDETPSGMLLHGIMSSIAEFYSANLANEVKKGSLQKVKSGGTAGKAPLGYLNVRETDPHGREARTVIVDPERASHVKWLFETYAATQHSLADLTSMLCDRGMVTRPNPKGGLRPLSKSQVGRTLRDPYYTGKTRYKGETYPGNHEPLISQELFDRVQTILDERNISGIRRRVHDHHLKGKLRCGYCDSRMLLSMNKNRHGTRYPYFYCPERRQKTCPIGYVNAELISSKLDTYYETSIKIGADQSERLVEYLKAEVAYSQETDQQAVKQAKQKIVKLETERKKLLRLFYDDAIDQTLFKDEQKRLNLDERTSRQKLVDAETNLSNVIEITEKSLQILVSWPEMFKKASAKQRREFNNIFFTDIYVYQNGETTPVDRSHYTAISKSIETLETLTFRSSTTEPQTTGTLLKVRETNIPNKTKTVSKARLNKKTETSIVEVDVHNPTTKNSLGKGSCTSLAVPPVGFEPTTNGLKVRCANQAAPQGHRHSNRFC